MARRRIIGAGPGEIDCAMALAQAGTQVTLVESDSGASERCLFESDVSSKIFRETARRLRELRESPKFGL